MSHDSSLGNLEDREVDALDPSLPLMSASIPGPAPSPQRNDRFKTGDMIFGDNYAVVRLLGRGGMGEVWQVRNLTLKRDEAIKLINLDCAAIQGSRGRFEREAEVMARIKHPNTVVIYGLTKFENQDVIIMEYINGKPLSQVIAGSPVMPLDQVVPIFGQLADLLDEVHRNGIVHRDLKPSNLMLVDGKQSGPLLKVLDFGIAKLMEPGEDLTVAGDFVGTSRYASPEQRDLKEVDRRSDIYAMGLLLYQLLTGRRLSTEAPRAAGWPWDDAGGGRNIPEPVRVLITRCLDDDPNQRPQSAGEVARGLSSGFSPAPASVSVKTRPRRLLIAAAAICLGAAVWYWSGGSMQQASEPVVATSPAAPGRLSVTPLRLGARGILAEVLDDVSLLSADQRTHVRYVSWNHRLAAGVPAGDVELMRSELEATLTKAASRPVKLVAAGLGRSAVYRLDLRDLGWNARPYPIAASTAADVRPPTLYDLILLEYPFGWVEKGLSERSDLESKYLNALDQARPLAYLRGDWLAEALTRPSLAADLGITLPSSPASSPDSLNERDAAAALGFADLAGYRTALDRLEPSDRPAELDGLKQGGTLTVEVWRRRFPQFIQRTGQGRPLPPVDAAGFVSFDAATEPVPLEIRPDRTVLQIGKPGLVVQFANRIDRPLFVEWVVQSDAGAVALPREPEHRGVVGVQPGPPATLKFDGPVEGPVGREFLVFFSSAARFPAGVLLQTPGRRARFVHLGDFPAEQVARTVIAVDTVTP